MQKLLFTAVAVNSSRICFDRTGHLKGGGGSGVESQLKLPLTGSSRSAPDKLIQKSLGFVVALTKRGCCCKARMTKISYIINLSFFAVLI